MHACAEIGSGLASIPAQTGGAINAGLTFAVPRNLNALPAACCARLVAGRLGELGAAADVLSMPAVATAIRRVETRFAAL
jgi:hypothetical protein